jgi:U4/U6 small nuclear ribonucleoprotein PRP31
VTASCLLAQCLSFLLPTPLFPPAMSTLADELMNDLDTDSEGEEEPLAGPSHHGEAEAEEAVMDEDNEHDISDAMLLPEGGVKPTQELDPEAVNTMDLASVAEVGKVAKLAGGKTMKDVLTVRPFGVLATQGGN